MANFGQIEHSYKPAVIANGSNVSHAINTFGNTIAGFVFPVGFEGATVTLSAATSPSGIYYPVKDPTTGSAITIYAGASAFVPIHLSDLAGIQYFKINSASMATADRTIVVVTRPAA